MAVMQPSPAVSFPPMGQAPRPALKPPQANAGMGPQPQMGQQPPFVARTPGWNPNGSNAGGAPAMPGAAPKMPSTPMQRTPNPMLMNGPAQGAPAATQTPSFASQQEIERARQRQQQSQQPMVQQIQNAAQGMRGQQPQQPMRQQTQYGTANNGPRPDANTTMPRPMNIPMDVPMQPQTRPQAVASPQQPMAAQPMYGQPTIDAGPVYSQQQQDQLINQAVGQNGMQAATNRQSMMSGLGAAGFAGGGSPKAMALENQIRAAQMGADNAARTGIPLQLAETNAKHLLASQQAQEDQYSNRQNERLTGQGQQLGFMQGLMGSLLTY